MLKNIIEKYIGNYKANLINDFKIKKLIIEYIFENININKIKEEVILNNNTLNEIKNNNYRVIYLNNGNNYILLLKEINNIYFSLIIKKNFKYNLNEINMNNLEIYDIDIKIPKDFYKGTIIEGRLEFNDNDCYFNIFNIIKLKDNNLDFPISEKMNIINDNFLNLESKNFKFKTSELHNIKNLKNNSNYIGILFIPESINNHKFLIYFNNIISKKYCHLYMQKINTDIFKLYAKNNNKIGIAHIPNIKTSHYFNKITEKIIVKCWYSEKFEKWVPFEIFDNIDLINTIDEIKSMTIKI